MKRFDPSSRNLSLKEMLFNFLHSGFYTATQAELALGIRSGSMCLLRKALRDEGRLFVGDEVRCPITGHKANLITTNPKLISNDPFQAELF
jgi:hypothetical protein